MNESVPGAGARCVMVLGTTSGAGKSWVATALCRWYARQGLRVAPFKAQNMSNNARVVAPTLVASRPALPPGEADFPWGGPAENRGGEIGSAQYFQALAARAVPEVRMNPLLLKPERDTHSQVVLLGQVSAELTGLPWRGRSERVWPQIAASLDALRAENDVVVIEGAGSPAEINLMASDIVNLRVARHADARCLLVTDIDRGGAFAHLYGTWALMPEADRALLRGFVLNKFRGDAALLAPAPQMLQDMTGVPTVATLPMWWQHGLAEEDGVFDDRETWTPTLGTGVSSLPPEGALAPWGGPAALGRPPVIAVVAYPRISNLDEFQPLKNMPGVRLRWVRSPAELSDADWVVLPGSKHTSGDLAWLRAQGL
ncbi:MAG: cobyric acid synthase, partial [Variovorax sp.]